MLLGKARFDRHRDRDVTGGDVLKLGAQRRHRPLAREASVDALNDRGIERGTFGHGMTVAETLIDWGPERRVQRRIPCLRYPTLAIRPQRSLCVHQARTEGGPTRWGA